MTEWVEIPTERPKPTRSGLIRGRRKVRKFRANLMIKHLVAWGQFVTRGAPSLDYRTNGNLIALMDGQEISDMLAYQSSGFSDYDCWLIQINSYIETLNSPDQKLLNLEFVEMRQGAAAWWESHYGKSAGRYASRKHELVNRLASKFID